MNKCGFEKGKRRVSLFCCFSGSKYKFSFQVLSKIFSGVSTNYFSGANTNCLFVCKHKLHFQVQTQIVFSCTSTNCLFNAKYKLPFQVQGTNCLFVCKHKLHFQVLIKNFLSVKCKLPFRCKHKLSFHAQAQITFQVQVQIAFPDAKFVNQKSNTPPAFSGVRADFSVIE